MGGGIMAAPSGGNYGMPNDLVLQETGQKIVHHKNSNGFKAKPTFKQY